MLWCNDCILNILGFQPPSFIGLKSWGFDGHPFDGQGFVGHPLYLFYQKIGGRVPPGHRGGGQRTPFTFLQKCMLLKIGH